MTFLDDASYRVISVLGGCASSSSLVSGDGVAEGGVQEVLIPWYPGVVQEYCYFYRGGQDLQMQKGRN